MTKHYNIYELGKYLKQKRRYMSVRQIAKDTGQTITSVNRKVKKLVPRTIERKVRNVMVGKRSSKCPVSFYRYKND